MEYKVKQMAPFFDKAEIKNVTKAIQTGWITEGPFSQEFVHLIREMTGAKHVVLANNGTLALFLALLAVGVGEGDEVIVPDFTFIASATSVTFTGATPIFVDVNPNNGLVDCSLIEAKITPRTKAIMPVHVYGQSADMDQIIAIAKRHNLKVVEDAAQGYGVFFKERHVGTMGDVGTISFFADKTITTGEGAAVLTNDDYIYDKLRYLRNQGRKESGSFIHPCLGMNFRMTDLQCAVGVAQIDKFEEIKRRKLQNYCIYREMLAEVGAVSFLEEAVESNIVPFRANILAQSAEGLMAHMEAAGIQTRGFFYPLHKQPCFAYLKNNDQDYTRSIELNQKGICLPVHCTLTREDIIYICNVIKCYYTK